MGKGKRIREGRAAEKEALKAAAIRKAKKDKVKKIGIIICSIAIVVALVAGTLTHTISSAVKSSGKIMRDTAVVESENFKVDAAMMSYYFNYNYNSTVGNNQETYESLGLDTSKSLKTQACSFLEDGGTWFDYFLDSALSTAKGDLYLAENAKKEGLELSETDENSIQSVIDEYYDYAEENNIKKDSIFSLMFGQGVKEGDVRNCLELSTLASKFVREWQDSLEYSDDAYDKFYKENIDNYKMVDYLSYTITASDTKDEETYAAAKEKAEELAGVAGEQAFKDFVEAEYRKDNEITDEFTKEEQDEGAKEALDKLLTSDATKGNIGDTDISTWFFESAAKGDTYIHDDESGAYTVYYCTAEPHRNEDITRTIRQIILTESNYGGAEEVEKQAIALQAEMKEKGLDEETFETYASKYSEDTNTSGIGGLCENYHENYFVDGVSDWAFNEARKAGDFDAVKYDSGYALCYYVGEGLPSWKADCKRDMINEDYEEAYEGWEKEIELTVNEAGYSKISLI